MTTFAGEAPETDSEDEQYVFNFSYTRVCIFLLGTLKFTKFS